MLVHLIEGPVESGKYVRHFSYSGLDNLFSNSSTILFPFKYNSILSQSYDETRDIHLSTMVQLCDGDNDDGDSYDCDSVTELKMVGLGEESRAESC